MRGPAPSARPCQHPASPRGDGSPGARLCLDPGLPSRAANTGTAQLRAGTLLPWGAHVSGLCPRGCSALAVAVPAPLTNP